MGLITYLQRLIGYCLTGDVSEQVLWFLYGTGANGKSTFLNTILALLGDYAMQSVSDLLMQKKNESHPTDRADLFGRRFVSTIETEQGKKLAEALVKQLTGGDTIRARHLYQDFFEFPPTHKILLAANYKPVVYGTDHAIWRRIKLIPFTVTITEQQKDKNLFQKLKNELPGILNWAIKGCLDWQKNGLGEPQEVYKATEQYRSEQDLLEQFITDHCEVHQKRSVQASILFDTFKNKTGNTDISKMDFKQRMENKKFKQERRAGGFFWIGIGLTHT
jgi:putative DNA primase/helicase